MIKSEKNPYSTPNKEFESIFYLRVGTDVDNEIEILQSKNLANRVAQSLGLRQIYYSVGNVKTSLNYPVSPFTFDMIHLTDSWITPYLNIQFVSGSTFAMVADEDNLKTSGLTSIHIPAGTFNY